MNLIVLILNLFALFGIFVFVPSCSLWFYILSFGVILSVTINFLYVCSCKHYGFFCKGNVGK